MGISIIIDSTTDLPEEIIKEYCIEVLPLGVYIDGRGYHDGVDINTGDVYKYIREGKVIETSQVSPVIFKNCFEKHALNGDSCIYIAFSSEMSGTYQTSIMIRNELLETYPNFDLDILDSRGGSTATGLTVYRAAKMARAGMPKSKIIEMIKFNSEHVEHIFTIDDLRHLHRTGRISKTSAVIGDLLGIKPILDVENGKIVPIEKARGQNKALKRILELMEKRGASDNKIIGISHADDLEIALKLKCMIEERFGIKDFMVNLIGSGLGVHLGIGGVGVFFFNKQWIE